LKKGGNSNRGNNKNKDNKNSKNNNKNAQTKTAFIEIGINPKKSQKK